MLSRIKKYTKLYILIGPMLMNHQIMNHCNGGPVEATARSSMDIRTSDMHPVPDIALPLVTQASSYGDAMYNHHLAGNHEPSPYVLNDPVVVWHNHTVSNIDGNNINHPQLSRSSSIMSIQSIAQQQQQQQQQQLQMTDSFSSPSSSSLSADDMIYQLDSVEGQMILQQQQQHQSRYTVSLPPCDKIQKTLISNKEEELTEKESRRQFMHDIPPNSFCHLSREELIERVVQLEKEKQLTSNKLLLDSKSITATSESKAILLDSNNNSDEDDCSHNCLWAGCDTIVSSLDQLINHIKDIHIGGGKAAYYCEWTNCSRERKPFIKRHKMQNHMRTHTGERPFECTIEDCDKKFSRQDSLNTHIKTHSSIRPYACLIEGCGKAYFHSRSLRKHAKSHETTTMTMEKSHPYDRSLKPPPKYHQPTTITTPITTTNTFYVTPTTSANAAVIAAEPIIIQHHQQQQIFAAGPAYVQLPPQQQQHYFIVSNNPAYATDTFYEQHQFSY
ncbi:unnamed protein product [Mucor hiemalis]